MGSSELRSRLLRRQEQQRLRSALVSLTVHHDRRDVSTADRLRASTVSLRQSRDQRARLTSFVAAAKCVIYGILAGRIMDGLGVRLKLLI